MEPCTVRIVPFQEHYFNDCDVCNTKRRNIYNLSFKFVNAVNAPALEEVCIKNFYDFVITTSKQYDDHQLMFDNSSEIVALSNNNIAVTKMSLQVPNNQTWNLYDYERLVPFQRRIMWNTF